MAGVSSVARFFNSLAGISSGPLALEGFRPCRSFSTPSSFMISSSMGGSWDHVVWFPRSLEYRWWTLIWTDRWEAVPWTWSQITVVGPYVGVTLQRCPASVPWCNSRRTSCFHCPGHLVGCCWHIPSVLSGVQFLWPPDDCRISPSDLSSVWLFCTISSSCGTCVWHLIGRINFTLECFEFSSNFEIDRNMLSRTGARTRLLVAKGTPGRLWRHKCYYCSAVMLCREQCGHLINQITHEY